MELIYFQMQIRKNDITFTISLMTAIWFAWSGMVWMYGAAFFIAYPAGLISFLLWRSLRKENRRRNKVIPIILLTGLVLSLGTLVYLLIWD